MLHGIVEREHILEEVADTMLCAMSIAYDIDYTSEDLENMLLKKSKKWATLQRQESDTKFPVPFEIHLTVSNDIDQIYFQHVCEEYSAVFGGKVKATKLCLYGLNGNVIMNDLMTSEVHIGDNRSVLARIESLVEFLKTNNIEVFRRKVETVPWHPAVPSETNNQEMPSDCYFETHIDLDKAKVEPLIQENYFRRLADETPGLAFSVNAKRVDTHLGMTLRDYKSTKEAHFARVALLKKQFENTNAIIDEITEFAIYDTNILHDEKWMNSVDMSKFQFT
jgi:hypothetical protein